MISAPQASATSRQIDPDAVAPSAETSAPHTLSATTDAYHAASAEVHSTISKDPSDGITMSSDATKITLTPQDVAETATSGRSVDDASAVVFANTATTDTGVAAGDLAVRA
jgi:hypothetical protein